MVHMQYADCKKTRVTYAACHPQKKHNGVVRSERMHIITGDGRWMMDDGMWTRTYSTCGGVLLHGSVGRSGDGSDQKRRYGSRTVNRR